LGCGSLVLKHYRCGAIVSRDLTDHRQFVGEMLPQGISLEAEQSGRRKEQHHAGDQHDHECDFLPNRAIA